MNSVISADGTRITFEQSGSGPSIVLVHGGFVDGRIWSPVARLLVDRFRVVIVERRGRGESGPYRSDHAIEREFEDVAAVVAGVVPPLTLVGHSLTAWCVLYGARLAGGVRRLVLYEPPPLWNVTEELVTKIRASLEDGSVDDAIATAFTGAIGMSPAQVEAIQGSPFWRLVAANARAFLAELDAGRGFRFDAQLFRDFATPTLLLLGTESPSFLRPITEQVAAALPDARVRDLEGQGHGAISAAPALFAEIVAKFALSTGTEQQNEPRRQTGPSLDPPR